MINFQLVGVYNYSSSSSLFKDFTIGLPNTIYTGVNNVPFTQYIMGTTAYYGNPFEKEGYSGVGGYDLKSCQITSSNPAIASVDTFAQITTKAPGNTTITVACNGISRSQDIKVEEGSYKGLTMPFPFDTYLKGYSNNYFMVNAFDQNGILHDVTSYASYSYSDSSILNIDAANKRANATDIGYTVITATYRGLTSSVPVIVVGASDPNVPNTAFSQNTQRTLENKSFAAGTTIRPELQAFMIDKLAYSDVTSDTLFALDDASKGRVNSDNSITLTKSGPVTIIVIYKNTYQKLYINVTPPRVTSIHFSTNSYTLHAGETLNTVLSATYSRYDDS